MDGNWTLDFHETFLWVSNSLTSLGSEFWSAVAGAVVGGVIAYVIQRQERRAARAERLDARRSEDKAQAHSLLFKVISIQSLLGHIKQHVDERLALLEENSTDIAGVLIPISNMPGEVNFSSAEMAMLLSLKDDETFNKVLSLDTIFNSIIPIWSLYSLKRSEMRERAIDHSFDRDEGRGTFTIKRGSLEEVLMFEVQELAATLVKRSAQDFAHAGEALAKLVKTLNERLNLGVSVVPKNG